METTYHFSGPVRILLSWSKCVVHTIKLHIGRRIRAQDQLEDRQYCLLEIFGSSRLGQPSDPKIIAAAVFEVLSLELQLC